MSEQTIPAEGLQVVVFQDGDAPTHEGRLLEWLAAHPKAVIVAIRFAAFGSEQSRTGAAFATEVFYRAG